MTHVTVIVVTIVLYLLYFHSLGTSRGVGIHNIYFISIIVVVVPITIVIIIIDNYHYCCYQYCDTIVCMGFYVVATLLQFTSLANR